MTWLAVLAAFALTGCVVMVVAVLRGRRRRGQIEEPSVAFEPGPSEAPADAAATRPYDVRACGVQALEALTERAHSVHEAPTREYAVPLIAKGGLTTEDELALSRMAEDGLNPARREIASGEVLLVAERRVRQQTAAHVVPRSLTSVSGTHPTTPAAERSPAGREKAKG
jgi:hypothetical protein